MQSTRTNNYYNNYSTLLTNISNIYLYYDKHTKIQIINIVTDYDCIYPIFSKVVVEV